MAEGSKKKTGAPTPTFLEAHSVVMEIGT